VLFSIPALISQGIEKIFTVFKPLPSGFYGLHHIIFILCFMALCRIKNPEQLKNYPPGELNEKLKFAIELAIPKIRDEITVIPKPGEPVFVLVFDREAYEPKWFIKLWKEYQIAAITYQTSIITTHPSKYLRAMLI
jgi:hypothetical protein